MKTKRCPFCHEEIHVDAKQCKHCCEFLDPKLRDINKNKSVKSPEGCFLQTLNLGCLIFLESIVLVVIIILIILAISS